MAETQPQGPDAALRATIDESATPQSPDKELRNIALQAAARAARFDDLAEDVGELSEDVGGLRTAVTTLSEQVGKAVKQEELRRSEIRTQRKVVWPLVIIAVGAVALVAASVFGGLALRRLDGIAKSNKTNGDYLVSCTTPPQNKSKAELRAHACYVGLRSDPQQTATVHRLECIEFIANGRQPSACDDTKLELQHQGYLPLDVTPSK